MKARLGWLSVVGAGVASLLTGCALGGPGPNPGPPPPVMGPGFLGWALLLILLILIIIVWGFSKISFPQESHQDEEKERLERLEHRLDYLEQRVRKLEDVLKERYSND